MKYNWSIIGHEKQLIQLEQDLESGNLSHAYLLTGPNSVGKHTVSRKMAGILQCENDFCHKCPACLQVSHGNHIDTLELEDDKNSIKIEDVRKIIERCSMTGQSKYKIFLIQSIERMTNEAANSFLKVLEEPPPKTVFILTTNSVRDLLPTIISRVRTIKFNHFSANYLEEKLISLYPDFSPETIKQISLLSMGKSGKALHLIENPDSLAAYMKVYRDVQDFLGHKNIVDRFSYVEDISGEKKDIALFLNILTHILRSKLLEGERDEKYINTLSKIEEAGILLKRNINVRLVLENLMLAL